MIKIQSLQLSLLVIDNTHGAEAGQMMIYLCMSRIDALFPRAVIR
jgi:hypothetical protein